MKEFKESLHKSELTAYRIACARTMTGRVLDVGGGLGAYLPYFGSNDVTVLDNNEEVLKRLNHHDKVLGDALNMPFPDNTFDNIWACAVCQYFDLDRFVAEAKRVIKPSPGGRIMILVPNRKSPWDYIKRFFGMKTWRDQENVFKHYSPEELKRYGQVTGEIRFLPFERLFRHIPVLGHTLMLEIKAMEDNHGGYASTPKI